MIPINTTTIAIRRPKRNEDPYDALTPPSKVATGIRAVIGSPNGRDHIIGGHQSIVNARLTADPCDLRHYDLIDDELTGKTYSVIWVRERTGFGLDHIEAGIMQPEGASNG